MRKELFIDDRFIAEMNGLTRRFQQAEPHAGNPVIHADRPWERDAAFVDTGLVIFDEGEGLFRAWYQGGACYGPDDRSCMCYALSEDGVRWEKPILGQVEFEGSSDNNIALLADCMMHDPAVIIDHKEADPARRYKAVWWGGRRDPSQPDGWLLGHCVGFSPDGVQWTEHPDNPVWPGDAEVGTPFGIARRDGKLVMYSSADGHGIRVVGRTESDDFVNWDLPPDLVFGHDEEDEPGTEFGGLAGIDYWGTHIGMLWVIRNRPGFSRAEWKEIVDRNIRQGFLGPPIQMNAAVCRTIRTELVVSSDGQGWQRVSRDAPLIPPGAAGTWDECHSLAGRPFVHDDRIWIYYTGCGRTSPTPGATEPEQIGNWSVDTGLATLRLDGFASLHGEGTGELLTRQFELRGSKLVVNSDAEDGEVRIALLNANGETVSGYGMDEARAIRGDHLRAPAVWRNKPDVSGLRGQTVQLRIRLKNADLYSITIVD